MPALEAYNRKLDYSYAPGVFPAMEALKKRPELLQSASLTPEDQAFLTNLSGANPPAGEPKKE